MRFGEREEGGMGVCAGVGVEEAAGRSSSCSASSSWPAGFGDAAAGSSSSSSSCSAADGLVVERLWGLGRVSRPALTRGPCLIP